MRFLGAIKAALIVVHRYTSAVLCLLFAAWFVSGVAMAYYRKPVLTEQQRLAFAQPLRGARPALPPAGIPTLAHGWPDTLTLRLSEWQGRPIYRWQTRSGWASAWADTGAPASFDGSTLDAEARRWFGGAAVRYDGTFESGSQWSYFTEVHGHYPLHRFSTTDRAPRQVFFSSRTGEPVVATSAATRAIYYLGPGLHYFSFYVIRNNDPLWRGLVNWSSGIGAFTCLLGLILGLWQLRWRAIGTGRRVVPYARTWMRWHHWTGLGFGLVTFTFVLSGLFSMNPGGMFASTTVPAGLDRAFRGDRPPVGDLPGPAALPPQRDPRIRELEWQRVRGQSHVVGRSDVDRSRLFAPAGAGLAERSPFSDAELMALVGGLLPAPVRQVERVAAFDNHYYARKDRHLPLPAVRLRLADRRDTWYYLNPATGELFLASDDGTRLRRWLYNGLHSFDIQPLLRLGLWWDATIWLLSLGGLALSITGVVITWQWIRRSLPAPAPLPSLRPVNEGKAD